MESKKTAESHGKASEQVAIWIRESILDGTWPAGEKIPSENSLAAKYGVSRVTVRAAIQSLASLGLLESRQGGGTYVCTPGVERQLNTILPFLALSKPDRVNVFEFRRTVETGAVALAAERADADVIQRMREASKRMKETSDIDEMAENDLEFHRLICEATGNPIFLKVFEVLRSTYKALMKGNVEIVGASGVSYHYMITYALEARDPSLAQTIMLRHLEQTMIGTGDSEMDPGEALDDHDRGKSS